MHLSLWSTYSDLVSIYIQIGLNGSEWLARQMDQAGLPYVQAGNCFPWIANFEKAQQLLEEQLETDWPELLNSFANQLNPLHEEIFTLYPAFLVRTCCAISTGVSTSPARFGPTFNGAAQINLKHYQEGNE